MTREEIREQVHSALFLVISQAMSGDYGEDEIDKLANTATAILNSLGVVIKVDRELPEVEFYDCGHRQQLMDELRHQYIRGMERMREVGYESLIKEE